MNKIYSTHTNAAKFHLHQTSILSHNTHFHHRTLIIRPLSRAHTQHHFNIDPYLISGKWKRGWGGEFELLTRHDASCWPTRRIQLSVNECILSEMKRAKKDLYMRNLYILITVKWNAGRWWWYMLSKPRVWEGVWLWGVCCIIFQQLQLKVISGASDCCGNKLLL